MKHLATIILIVLVTGCGKQMTAQEALDKAVLAQQCFDLIAECSAAGKQAQSDEEILGAFQTCFDAIDESQCMTALYDELEAIEEDAD